VVNEITAKDLVASIARFAVTRILALTAVRVDPNHVAEI